MKVFRNIADAAGVFGPSALTIGNFDGVHFGHRQILRRVVALASSRVWRDRVAT